MFQFHLLLLHDVHRSRGGRQLYLYTIQLEAEEFNPPDVFTLPPIVNKSCNIECCVDNMLQIIQNMMVSQVLELELSIFRRTTISGQHPLVLGMDLKFFEISIQPLQLYFDWSRGLNTFENVGLILKLRDADLI